MPKGPFLAAPLALIPALSFADESVPDTPVVATSGMSIGHKGMIAAAETLAATMVDQYKAYLPDGPPELPKEE